MLKQIHNCAGPVVDYKHCAGAGAAVCDWDHYHQVHLTMPLGRSTLGAAAGLVALPLGAWVTYRTYTTFWRRGTKQFTSYTAIAILAGRVSETLHSEAQLQYAVAVGMMGPFQAAASVQRIEAHAARVAAQEEQDAAASTGGKQQSQGRWVNPITSRSFWLDSQLMAALHAILPLPAAAAAKAAAGKTSDSAPATNPAPDSKCSIATQADGSSQPLAATAQVVLLGAGLDARAWRLPLPPGRVAWFELDQADLLAVKFPLLATLGAQLAPGSSRHPAGCLARVWAAWLQAQWLLQLQGAAAMALMQRLARRGSGLQQVVGYLVKEVAAKLPLLGGAGLELRAASYAAVAADLNQADWPSKLQAAGWDPALPTVWVAEGLTYYLEAASLKALIQTTASISAPGSRLLLTTLNEASGIWLHSEEMQAVMLKAKMPAHLRQWARQFRTFCPDVKPWLEEGCAWGVVQVMPADGAAKEMGAAGAAHAFLTA